MLIGITAKRKLERLAGYFEGTITETIERLIDERTLSLWTQLNDEDREAFLEGRLTQTDFLTNVTGSVLRRTGSGRKLNEALASALEREGELSLVYQPIQHLAHRRITGFEALMRWSHPEFGNVPPGLFIPLAEETGLIHALGLFALRHACLRAAGWPDLLTVSVNVSAHQLADESFLLQVQETLQTTGLAAERLCLEITESAVMRQHTVALLEQIHKLGVRLSIDDFGTGYSSLAYLKRLPVDSIKLDRSFVQGVPHDSNDSAIAGAIVGLGRSLGLAVVAEGVERDEQREYLGELGCDALQGYLISPPMPAHAVPGWLRQADAP